MRSARGRQVQLQLRDSPPLSQRLDNYIYVSSELTEAVTPLLTLKKQGLNALLSTGSGMVTYPVVATRELKKNEIYIPSEICRDFSLRVNDKLDCVLDQVAAEEWCDAAGITFTVLAVSPALTAKNEIVAAEVGAAIKQSFAMYPKPFPLQAGQVLILPFRGVKLEVRVDRVDTDQAPSGSRSQKFYRLSEATKIKLVSAITEQFNFQGDADISVKPKPKKVLLDLKKRGIGGFQNQIRQIARTTFCPRTLTQEEQEDYGIETHSKGILLYGPPGTGKTIIAKAICAEYTDEEVKTVSGPELKSIFYGGSQQNVADVFIKARTNPQKLYAFIFDEIDALFVTRGSDDSVSTSNNNDLVNRFLGILDGAATLDNIIVIGTTNRKELLDPAVLRAGRLETHIYIGLPDEKDRLEILQVHTSKMSKTLAADVDLAAIARLAKNYSGAELARIVRLARSYAIMENFDDTGDELVRKNDGMANLQLAKVTQQYFLRALREVQPMFGVDEEVVHVSVNNFVLYDDHLRTINENFQRCMKTLQSDQHVGQLNFLISGGAGTGKTSLAMYLAKQSTFTHVQVLDASRLLGNSTNRQMEILDEVFARARQSSEPSVIVLDGIENLIEATPDYQQYNNRLRIKLNELLKGSADEHNRILVVASTENKEFIEQIGLGCNFSEFSDIEPVQIDSGKPEHRALICSIADSIGIRIRSDESDNTVQCTLSIPIKQLIYHLRKYAAQCGHNNMISLSGLIASLPQQFHVKENISVIPQSEAASTLSFFSPRKM